MILEWKRYAELLDLWALLLFCGVLLSGCWGFHPDDYQQQLFIPICKLDCVTLSGESVEVIVWGEDELGRTVCHARTSEFTSPNAQKECNKTHDAFCDFARRKHVQEMPSSACEIAESFLYSGCVKITQSMLKRESLRDGALIPEIVPKDMPDCDIVIEH